ncbi:MAG: hypothetical protein HOE90_24415 [Bacteriovoracaceae bacterium]|nr:hypothetical protein [Bacteriovoracaceae bacterium]
MKIIIIFLIFSNLFVQIASAKNYVLLAGGGCLKVDDGPFESEVQSDLKKYRELGIETHVLFGGGPDWADGEFSKGKFISYLQGLELNEGDQLIIQINTHGGKEDEKNEHTLCITSKEEISVSELKVEVDRVKDKVPNVNIAIFDNSCFGGNIHKYFPPENYCTISSAPSFLPASFDNPFNINFRENLETGRSLEKSYLKTLKSKKVDWSKLYRGDYPMMGGINSDRVNPFFMMTSLEGLFYENDFEEVVNDAEYFWLSVHYTSDEFQSVVEKALGESGIFTRDHFKLISLTTKMQKLKHHLGQFKEMSEKMSLLVQRV